MNFATKYKTKDFCIWMFRLDDKKSIVDDVFGKFHDTFGFYPSQQVRTTWMPI